MLRRQKTTNRKLKLDKEKNQRFELTYLYDELVIFGRLYLQILFNYHLFSPATETKTTECDSKILSETENESMNKSLAPLL